jgi:flagellar protein FlaG
MDSKEFDMNIQPTGVPVAIKPEERQTQAIEPQAPVAAPGGKTAGSAAEPSRKDLTEAVDKINGALGSAQGLEFSIDEDTKGIVVKVIDLDTKEVLRQMPSKVALEIARSIDKTRGLLIDHTA